MSRFCIAVILVIGAMLAVASPAALHAAAPVLQTPIPAGSPFIGAHVVGDGDFTLTLGADGRARLDRKSVV